MVYQQFINYPNFNVYDNIASPLRVAGMGAAEIEKRVGAAAELLRLPVASAARRLLLSGVGLCSLEADPKAATAELAERAEWGKAQRKAGRPVIASAHS